MLKKHYSPGLPILINQKKSDKKVLLFTLVINLKIKKIILV